ncbi:MAG: hypothetical protein IPJ84_01220 [Bdellovibrionales bacterium]|nr:hypothetical protein [Bdellovibrionales bacterium]
MDGMSPLLRFVYQVDSGFRRFQDFRTALLYALEQRADDVGALRAELLRFVGRLESREDVRGLIEQTGSPYRRALYLIILDGFNGQPVFERLSELKADLEDQAELDIESHIDRLPLLMLAPLLLLQFPAFLILLLGPIASHFLEALK